MQGSPTSILVAFVLQVFLILAICHTPSGAEPQNLPHIAEEGVPPTTALALATLLAFEDSGFRS